MQKKLDVRELEPCEPLEQTLSAIRELHDGEYLRVLHRRQPNLLFPMLEKSGFQWLCQQSASGHYEVLIWQSGDGEGEAEASLYASTIK